MTVSHYLSVLFMLSHTYLCNTAQAGIRLLHGPPAKEQKPVDPGVDPGDILAADKRMVCPCPVWARKNGT